MKTIKLRDYRTNPNAPLYIFLGVIALLFLVNAFTPAQERPKSAFIYILTTPVPTQPLPTADTRELEALRARVAELEAQQSNPVLDGVYTAQPVYNVMAQPAQPTQPGYTAQTDQGPVFVPDSATPVPMGTTYDGPFLAPVQPTVPPNARQYCTGFHDWRDYDGAYEASPACHK